MWMAWQQRYIERRGKGKVERLFELLQQQSMQNNEGVSVIARQMDGMECDVQTN